MTDLRQSLDLAVERFRLEWGLPEVASGNWWRETDGEMAMRWPYGVHVLKHTPNGNWLARFNGEWAYFETLPDAVAWLAAHGLDVRPEPERHKVKVEKLDESDPDAFIWPLSVGSGFIGVSFDEGLPHWGAMWNGLMQNFDTCEHACDWIRSQMEESK